MKVERTKLTPPQIARIWGVSADKVLAWIRQGELRAIDGATRRGGRPRYLVDVEELKLFEQRRRVESPPISIRRKRRREEVVDFFRGSL